MSYHSRFLIAILCLSLISISTSESLFAIYRTIDLVQTDIVAKSTAASQTITGIEAPLEHFYMGTDTDGAKWSLSNFSISKFTNFGKTPEKSINFQDGYILITFAQTSPTDYSVNFELKFTVDYDKPQNGTNPEVKLTSDATATIVLKRYTHKQHFDWSNVAYRMFNEFDLNYALNDVEFVNQALTPQKLKLIAVIKGLTLVTDTSAVISSKLAEQYNSYYSENLPNYMFDFATTSGKPRNIDLVYDENPSFVANNAIIEYFTGNVYNPSSKQIDPTTPPYIPEFTGFDPTNGNLQIFVAKKLFTNILRETTGENYVKHFSRFGSPVDQPEPNMIQLNINYFIQFLPDLVKTRSPNEALFCEFIIENIEYSSDDHTILNVLIFFISNKDLSIILEVNLDLELKLTYDLNSSDPYIGAYFGGSEESVSVSNIKYNPNSTMKFKRKLEGQIRNTISAYFLSQIGITKEGINLTNLVPNFESKTVTTNDLGAILSIKTKTAPTN